MGWIINVTGDGFEIRLIVVWQKLRVFAQSLAYTIWWIMVLLAVLKAAGIDVIALLVQWWGA